MRVIRLLAFSSLAARCVALSEAHEHRPRQAGTPTCDPFQGIDTGHGGRKIGIVIDASRSMATNDPENLRLEAAQELNSQLVQSSTATDGQVPDLVSVVKFSDDADLLYPLGDPSGASAHIAAITIDAGTFIGRGVKTSTDDLVKPGTGVTAGRTAMVILTDGLDDPASRAATTAEEIRRAGREGIRVSLGFLSIDASEQDPSIVEAVLDSGGTLSMLSDPVSLTDFLRQVFVRGLTSSGSDGAARLLPGMLTAARLPPTGPAAFVYSAHAGETFNVTVRAVDGGSLLLTLRDGNAGADLASAVTNRTGVAVLQYTAPSATNIDILVTAVDVAEQDIFYVGVDSSASSCGTNTTTTTNTTIATPTVTWSCSRTASYSSPLTHIPPSKSKWVTSTRYKAPF